MRSGRGSRPVKKYTRGGGYKGWMGVDWGEGERRKPQGGDTRTRIDFYISFLA